MAIRLTARQSRYWHTLLAAVVLASFVLQFALIFTGGTDVNSGDATSSLGVGARLVNLFSYFTIQSNVLVVIAAVSLVANPSRDGKFWRILRLDALLGIIITGFIFATVLASEVHHEGISGLINDGFHYFAPWWTVGGWLLFGPRPRISWHTLGWAFVWPLAWIAYTFVRGAITDWYPYPFLNAAELGYGKALFNTAMVVVIAAAIALLLKFLDRKLPTAPR
ncbi:Pr6Pr family membrane protein [Catelliglobosispora koreensis]|uniref:Pr6Pr family membrane protein n=1 Tax=Catelliglobosispora koreensis TaxID=129052 RepID=UPI000375E35E|nr:Pr6Pr family membrane protein [Catelliglobosispora koreensis]